MGLSLKWISFWIISTCSQSLWASGSAGGDHSFPLPLSSYNDSHLGLFDQLFHRIDVDPFNLVASLIFLGAILHTFVASTFMKLSHDIQHRHTEKLLKGGRIGKEHRDVSFLAKLLHFFGEVEAIFGIWVIALFIAIITMKGWNTAIHYIGQKVNYTEPMFVVVIMAMSATRPILNLMENILKFFARLGNGSPGAWWFSILTLGPILGSLITEPAAMTISALLLSKQFFRLKPSTTFKYATIGLLFVNVSVGGTLTNFAAPPVLMVAGPWKWSTTHMIIHFGLKAVLAILISNIVYYLIFKNEFKKLALLAKENLQGDIEVTSDDQSDLVPSWVTFVHILFLLWTVVNSHYPPLFIAGFLLFLGFIEMTPQHQNRLNIQSPLLVGFFLAGLVTHGNVQGWWISPVLGSLTEFPLMTAATILTAFNDNAAITYLSTLVENFSDTLKYAVVAGAVTGGGLTVIANAPNPAGQSILSKFFKNKSVSPLYLALGALFPTIIVFICFWFIR